VIDEHEHTDSVVVDSVVAYGLAGLAEASGVSERTIRYYQAEHLLPPPVKKGRDAVYGDEHRDRLTLIAELRDRGLTLQTIGELVSTRQPMRTVSEWLGVDATLSAPWSDDRPAAITHDELVALVDDYGDVRPGLIAELHDARYVELQPDGMWLIPSPALLDHALQLRQAGIDVEVSAMMRDLLRRRLSNAVADTVKLLVERAGAGFAGGATPEELATAVGALRPIARETSSVILAQEVERALANLVKSGPRSLRRSRRR
jgi:DNA-binding transcriptional MerR regulator